MGEIYCTAQTISTTNAGFIHLRERLRIADLYAFKVLNELIIFYCTFSVWWAEVQVSPLDLVGTHFKDTLAEQILLTPVRGRRVSS